MAQTLTEAEQKALVGIIQNHADEMMPNLRHFDFAEAEIHANKLIDCVRNYGMYAREVLENNNHLSYAFTTAKAVVELMTITRQATGNNEFFLFKK